MSETTVGIRELKARLSEYIDQVKAGTTLVITERGQPVGRIVPIAPSAEERMQELVAAGVVAWSGARLGPLDPIAAAHGDRAVADLLLEDRE